MATVTLLTNPRKRKKSSRKTPARKSTALRASTPKKRKSPKRRKNPVGTPVSKMRTIRRRRNPIKARGVVDANLMPSLKGALGAIAIDSVYNMLPVPAEMQVGAIGHVVKGGVAIALGMLAENMKLTKKDNAQQMVNGALTVQLHGLAQEMLGGFIGGSVTVPTETGVSYAGAALTAGPMPGMGMYDFTGASDGLGMYDYTGV